MSANMTVDSSSSTSDDNQNIDSVSSSYANVVLNLKTAPREDKNDNNKENIEKDGNQINNQGKVLTSDSVQPTSSPIAGEPIMQCKFLDNNNGNNKNTITEQQQQQVELSPNKEPVPNQDTEDDLSFIPVVSHHNRKERKFARRDRPTREKASGNGNGGGGGSSAAPPSGTGTSTSRPRRNRADRSANRGERKGRRSKGDAASGRDPVGANTNKDKDAKLVEQQPGDKDSAAATKSGNEEDVVESAPVKFVEAPIPKVNAWKVGFFSIRFY